jgi:hypothetical protein
MLPGSFGQGGDLCAHLSWKVFKVVGWQRGAIVFVDCAVWHVDHQMASSY